MTALAETPLFIPEKRPPVADGRHRSHERPAIRLTTTD